MVTGCGFSEAHQFGWSSGAAAPARGVLHLTEDVAHRRYEALRAYFVEEASAAEVAERFGYAPSTVVAMVRDFTAEAGEFFVERRPGPTVAPSKLAARDEVLRLRAAGHSVTEIAQALAAGATPLNRTGVWELLVAEGHERLAPRAPGERGAPTRDDPPRVRMLRWPEQPLTLSSDHAGVMLLLPALVALDLPGAVAGARFPGTREVPALSSVLSLLALKAIGHRRVSHVDDVCTDPALAAFAGLESLPKASSLGSYSYRLTRSHDQALLAGLARAMTRTGQTHDADFDLDFHAIMHFGDDVALETHYVPRRSQRTEAVLSFFVQDGETRNLVYANAACTKADQASQAIAFARHWQDRDRPATSAAGVRLQGHDRRRSRRTKRRRADASSRCAPAPRSSPPTRSAARQPLDTNHARPSRRPTQNPRSTNRTSPSAAARPHYARSRSAASVTTTPP